MTDEGENLWRENNETESDFDDTDSVDRVWNETQAKLKKKATQPEILVPDSDPDFNSIEEIGVSEISDSKSRKIDWNTKSSAKNLQRAQYRRNQEDSVQA